MFGLFYLNLHFLIHIQMIIYLLRHSQDWHFLLCYSWVGKHCLKLVLTFGACLCACFRFLQPAIRRIGAEPRHEQQTAFSNMLWSLSKLSFSDEYWVIDTLVSLGFETFEKSGMARMTYTSSRTASSFTTANRSLSVESMTTMMPSTSPQVNLEVEVEAKWKGVTGLIHFQLIWHQIHYIMRFISHHKNNCSSHLHFWLHNW